MTKSILAKQPLRSIFWFSGAQMRIYKVALVLLGSFLVAAAAQIEIPMVPVPVTLQTFAVMLIGMSLGWRSGTLSVALYLLEGAIGIPVFSGFTAGISVLFGLHGGYLLSYLIAVAFCGWLIERGWGRHFVLALVTALLGSTLILVVGAAYLSVFIGWQKASVLGILPFLYGDVLKSIMLAVIVPTLWRRQA